MKQTYHNRLEQEFKKTNNAIQLAYNLDKSKFYLEAGFIRKFYLQKKENKQVQIELYLSRDRFFKLKKIINLLYIKHKIQ